MTGNDSEGSSSRPKSNNEEETLSFSVHEHPGHPTMTTRRASGHASRSYADAVKEEGVASHTHSHGPNGVPNERSKLLEDDGGIKRNYTAELDQARGPSPNEAPSVLGDGRDSLDNPDHSRWCPASAAQSMTR